MRSCEYVVVDTLLCITALHRIEQGRSASFLGVRVIDIDGVAYGTYAYERIGYTDYDNV